MEPLTFRKEIVHFLYTTRAFSIAKPYDAVTVTYIFGDGGQFAMTRGNEV